MSADMVVAIDLPVTRYRFDCIARDPIRLPDYAGSLLRGAFGRALRQVACITRARDCGPCTLKPGCPYAAVFAPGRPASPHPRLQTSEIPAPYVIEPPPWGARVIPAGEGFVFHMVLIGRARDHLPIVILAWRRALESGLGAGDGRAGLAAVASANGHVIYDPADGRIAPIAAATPAPTFGQTPAKVTLCFDTPLRLQHQGRALPPHRLTPRPLILAAARRASLLAEFHGAGTPSIDWKTLSVAADHLDDRRCLDWRDWTRYSSRQQQKMQLGGVVGRWTLHGDLELAMPWLHLGQWLHIGKETVFGLGGYRLEADCEIHSVAPDGEDCGRPVQHHDGKEEEA